MVVTQEATATIDGSIGPGTPNLTWDLNSGELSLSSAGLSATDRVLDHWAKVLRSDTPEAVDLLMQKDTVKNPITPYLQAVTIGGKTYHTPVGDIDMEVSLTIEDGYPKIEEETSISFSVQVGQATTTVKLAIVTDATLTVNVGKLPPLLVPVLVAAAAGGAATLGVVAIQRPSLPKVDIPGYLPLPEPR